MKIEITTNEKTLDAAMNTVADIVNEFKPGEIDSSTRYEAKMKIRSSSRVHQGPAYSWQYANKARECTATVEIEDDAIVMALPVVLKVVKAISPIIEMGIAACKMVRNLKDQFNAIGNDFTTEFGKKFYREKTYAVASLVNADVEMGDVVVVEDDGFGNQRLVHAEHCWSINKADIIMKVFNAARKRYEETKDSKTLRYPEIEFKKMTKDEAIKLAQEFRCGLQADVDGMRGVTTDETHGKIAANPDSDNQ